MAHFAKLDHDNIVTAVIVVDDEWLNDGTGTENEAQAIEKLREWSGGHAHWVQTSFNGKMRVRYAGLGHVFDPVRDAFIPPQPAPSWVLNEETLIWEDPDAPPPKEVDAL